VGFSIDESGRFPGKKEVNDCVLGRQWCNVEQWQQAANGQWVSLYL